MKNNKTTLFQQSRELNDRLIPRKYSFSYAPEVINKLKSAFSRNNMQMVLSSNRKLKNQLGSTNDKTANLRKSGIYSVQCGDFEQIYYGRTSRNIETRFKEHSASIKYNKHRESALAAPAAIDFIVFFYVVQPMFQHK